MISFEYDVYPHSANSLGVMSTLSDVIDHEAIQTVVNIKSTHVSSTSIKLFRSLEKMTDNPSL